MLQVYYEAYIEKALYCYSLDVVMPAGGDYAVIKSAMFNWTENHLNQDTN